MTRTLLASIACGLLFGLAAVAGADDDSDEKAALEVGDRAPHFRANDDRGELWVSSDHFGDGPVVLYFYPAAMTGGCTKQACSFRDTKSKLAERGVNVVGISGDSVRNLQLFKKANDLNFPLISDPDGSVAEKYGVPVSDGGQIERQIEGQMMTLQRGATFQRWTYMVDESGKIAYRDTSVEASEDGQQVLAAIDELKDEQ